MTDTPQSFQAEQFDGAVEAFHLFGEVIQRLASLTVADGFGRGQWHHIGQSRGDLRRFHQQKLDHFAS